MRIVELLVHIFMKLYKLLFVWFVQWEPGHTISRARNSSKSPPLCAIMHCWSLIRYPVKLTKCCCCLFVLRSEISNLTQARAATVTRHSMKKDELLCVIFHVYRVMPTNYYHHIWKRSILTCRNSETLKIKFSRHSEKHLFNY